MIIKSNSFSSCRFILTNTNVPKNTKVQVQNVRDLYNNVILILIKLSFFSFFYFLKYIYIYIYFDMHLYTKYKYIYI